MPAKDIIHDAVKAALVKDGWTITHEPLSVRLSNFRVMIDFAAEKIGVAEKVSGRIAIAVEAKSFVGASVIDDLEKAVGQYKLYEKILAKTEPDRTLYLGISQRTYSDVFDTPAGRLVIAELGIKIVVIDLDSQEVAQWIE